MEDMALSSYWHGRSVFVTGHTGFMGGWLASTLLTRGARVHGYALDPPGGPSFFVESGLARRLTSSTIGDIRDGARLRAALLSAQPEIVFHLAAQPLVRAAHHTPIETFSVNVMGTAQLLEELRGIGSVRTALIVTTDKVYLNDGRASPYRENDRLGGREPYSASKACCEFVVEAWRHSYLRNYGISVATMRAGNIFGGGDWAADRLVPDAIRNFSTAQPLILRRPQATRPWQHVLEPVAGYLLLAEHMTHDPEGFGTAWNFGPPPMDCRPVAELAQLLAAAWGHGATVRAQPENSIFEETLLSLDSTRAETALGWHPRWTLDTAVLKAAEWYRAHGAGRDMWELTQQQIQQFESVVGKAS
jgi:CDP-glucose 4,6-dehydratase